MPRGNRLQGESDVYHVMSRGVEQRTIFQDDADRSHFVASLQRLVKDDRFQLYAWCLMGNHYHLLVMSDFQALSKSMHCLNSLHAHYFNKRHERMGHLFQDRFKSEPVDSDEYFLTALRYIHRNPEKAGIAPASLYPWSSYREYVGQPTITNTALALNMLGGIDGFKAFHREAETDEMHDGFGDSDKPVSDAEATHIAAALLPCFSSGPLLSLSKAERNEAIRALKRARLTTRQIERITGISRSTVSRI